MRAFVILALLSSACSRSFMADDASMAVPLDVVGSWHDCRQRLRFDADGTADRTDYRLGCSMQGTWTIEGSRVHLVWQSGDCDSGGGGEGTLDASRTPTGLVLIDVTGDHVARYASDDTPRAMWRLAGANGSTGVSVARVVGTLGESFGSACYWSEDRACGGLLSCSGVIDSWSLDTDSFAASATCGSDCPCAAILLGTPQSDGTLHATFSGVNCDRNFEGQLVASPIDEN